MSTVYEIGPFRLDAAAAVLTHAGVPVALGPRGVAVLAALVRRPHEYVLKASIIDAAWPDVVVEEANLAVQISSIRRVLAQAPGGERWVETLTRRGYRFVGPVTEVQDKVAGGVGSSSRRSNLPEPLTSFIGRERELVDIKRLLPRTRLLTLVGVGGIGKTRLALQVAAEVLDAYHDGVWMVELAALSDPGLVPQAVAAILGIKEQPKRSFTQTLTEHLASKRLLLMLDNAEHLLAACAQLADVLLPSCPQVVILATSREGLGIAGEQIYRVPALSMPDPARDATAESLSQYESARLFVERARLNLPHFAVTDQNARALALICHQLDGIPLALELAAARVRAMSVQELNTRLDQRFRLVTGGSPSAPRRQQTLRSLIDWSYDLLSDAEKALLCRVSIFAGGWTLEAAEHVSVGGGIDDWEALDLLTSLADKSLVVAEEKSGATRYRLLETVRQYARERLQESGEETHWRARHLAYYLALAEQAEPQLTGMDQQAWLDRLEVEHDNLRSALTLSPPASGLQLAGALWRFWYLRGYLGEGRASIARLLAAAPTELDAATRAKALHGAGALAWQQGDYQAARELCEVSLALRRDLGDQMGISMTLNTLGLVAYQQCDYASARALHEESLAIRRALGDRHGIAQSLHNLGLVASDEGDYPSARALHEASHAIFRELGNRQGIAQSLANQGDVAFNLGDYDSARALYDESLAIQRELGDRWGSSISLNNLANVALQQGDYPSARRMHEESLALRRELGDQQGVAQSLHSLANVAREQGDYSSAQVLYKESLAIKRELGDKWGIAGSLEGIAYITLALAAPGRAACVWGGAERLREEIGSALPPKDRPGYDLQVAAARAALGDDVAFDRAWKEGRAMTMEQNIDYALKGQDT